MAAWEVTANESGQKLSVFLKDKLGGGYSSRRIKQAIEQNACQINGRMERFASAVVGRGDRVVFEDVEAHGKGKMTVLYEDAHLLACDKPAGVSSEDSALVPQPGLELLHRLDKDTTGVLLWAKTPLAASKMHDKFKQRQVKKTYLALVDGIPKDKAGHIENLLGKLHQYQGQSLWGPVEKGLLAITDWQLEKKLRQAALLSCFPHTGRTHQIRVHLSSLGHPILGDKQYGKRFLCTYRPSRCLLHAQKVSFIHPETDALIEITAPMPADMQDALNVLGAK